MVLIAMDIGGTKIKTVSFNKKRDLLFSLEIPTESDGGKKQVLSNMLRAIEVVVRETKKTTSEKITSLAVSMPGVIKEGKILFPGLSLSFFKNLNIKNYLEKNTGLKTEIFNDADSFLVAEVSFNENIQQNKILGIIIGSGLGSSLVVKESNPDSLKLIKGSELGHIKVFDEDKKAYVDLETLVGGHFIEKEYFKKTGKKKTMKEIYYSKDSTAKKLVKRLIKYLALGISYAVNIYGSEVVVLGGGLSNLPIIKDLNKQVSSLVIPNYSRVKIKRYSIEDDEAIFGLALLVLN